MEIGDCDGRDPGAGSWMGFRHGDGHESMVSGGVDGGRSHSEADEGQGHREGDEGHAH
jgi:hypothetical protein